MASANYILAAGTTLLAFTAAQAANAYEAYVNVPAPILTGPSPDYPPVVYLHGGETVEVYGCLEGYDWCDVQFRDFRGWFDAGQLSYAYDGQYVPFYEYGYNVGLPIIGFSLDEYWGRYYRDRPFFEQRDRWAHIQLPPPRDHHFEGRAGFEGRPGFDHAPGRPEGGPIPGRPDFNRPESGRPEAGRPESGRPESGRPEAVRPQFDQQHQQQGAPQARPQGGPQPQARPQGGPAPQPRPQGGPPQAAHPQAAHPQPQAPHPQAAPQGGAHPEHGEEHHEDNK